MVDPNRDTHALKAELKRLREGLWISDYGIHSYLALLIQEAASQKRRYGHKVVILSGQIMESLESKGYDETTKNWKHPKDVVGADLVLWYLNPGQQHWTLMVIDVKAKRMTYYDSFISTSCCYFHSPLMRNFFDAEAKKAGYEGIFRWDEWCFTVNQDIPRQLNGSDCGIFVMQYALCLVQDIPMNFSQDHMPMLRELIATELETCKILHRNFESIACHYQSVPHHYSLAHITNMRPSNDPMHKTRRQRNPSTDQKVNKSHGHVDSCSSSSDFEGDVLTRKASASKCNHATSKCNKTSKDGGNSSAIHNVKERGDNHAQKEEIKPVEWNCLHPGLQALLPAEEGLTYVVTEFSPLPTETFHGAPENSFQATVRVNLTKKETAQSWMEKMMQHSKCTYRHSRGRTPGLKRVLYKAEMHCQHQQKKLTPKQQQKASEAKSKNSRKVLTHDTRMKKTDCPSKLRVTVLVPSKRDRLASEKKPYLVSHPMVFHVTFNHNHPLNSAHALSFRPISQETKELFIELFRKGHTAASAHHWHETKLYLDGGEDQSLLADRASNPTKSDISRLYTEWQKREHGDDNGKEMFDKLRAEIDAYNESCNENGGKAKVQIYQGADDLESDDSDFESDPPPKKKRRKDREKPMIITICTPLMSRVHEHIQQAGEMIFCDSTSTLDRFNTSMFILSTSHPAGGLPLGVMITSDEQEETLAQGLNQLTEVLPQKAFYGRGAGMGPLIAMTDDSSAERNALHSVWSGTRLLLCTFHFLQRKWTWLHDSHNRIADKDRAFLINKTKCLVYAESEDMLLRLFDDFQKCSVVKRYPHFLSYIKSQWDRKKEWALCYRKHLLVRGNQTNNYAEAGMRILKDLVFSRVKAYNLVQMFSFVTECLELYYTRKILSVTHNRYEHHISLKFQGIKCSSISKSQIQQLDEGNGTYLVNSQSERGVKYLVDMKLGVCSCTAGQDGSPCSHQAAIVNHFHVTSVNCIPTLSSATRQQLAMIAKGGHAVQDPTFYSSLHQKKQEQSLSKIDTALSSDCESPAFTGTEWDLMRSSAMDVQVDTPDISLEQSSSPNVDELVKQIEEFSKDITTRVRQNAVVAQGMQTFLRRYKNLTESGQFHNARLSSALHRFGWVFGGSIKSTQGGYLRRGRRIPVNALSAGRRRKSASKGKAKLLPGRPKGMKVARYPATRCTVPSRKQAPGKRLHSLKDSIQQGRQNGGKW